MLNQFLKIATGICDNPELASKNYTNLSSKIVKIFTSNVTDIETTHINPCHVYKSLCNQEIS